MSASDRTRSRSARLARWGLIGIGLGFLSSGLGIFALLIQQGALEVGFVVLPPTALAGLGAFMLLGVYRSRLERALGIAEDDANDHSSAR